MIDPNMQFETAIKELEDLIKKLENNRLPLEEAIIAFEKGSKLKKFCEEKLNNAKLKIDEIQINENSSKTE